MEKEIKQTWQFNQPAKEVWEYLTRPELIEQWLMKTDFKPLVGHLFTFSYTPKPGSPYDGTVNCEVLEVKPFTRLSYTWNGGLTNSVRTFNSTIVWTLVSKGSGTELQLNHSGFTVLEDVLAHTSGWKACLQRFEDHINLVKI
jgi:uncharacterized protein YndB with AHSA1/START domain